MAITNFDPQLTIDPPRACSCRDFLANCKNEYTVRPYLPFIKGIIDIPIAASREMGLFHSLTNLGLFPVFCHRSLFPTFRHHCNKHPSAPVPRRPPKQYIYRVAYRRKEVVKPARPGEDSPLGRPRTKSRLSNRIISEFFSRLSAPSAFQPLILKTRSFHSASYPPHEIGPPANRRT